MTLTRIISRSPTHSIAHPRNQHRQERIEREKTMTTTNTDAADAPDLEIIDAATATGMVRRPTGSDPANATGCRLRHLPLRGSTWSPHQLRPRRPTRLGRLPGSLRPTRPEPRLLRGLPLKPSTTYGTGVSVWTGSPIATGSTPTRPTSWTH